MVARLTAEYGDCGVVSVSIGGRSMPALSDYPVSGPQLQQRVLAIAGVRWPSPASSAGTAAGIDACLYLVRKEQGSTPQRWLIGQRILLAQQLLEESDETVDAIADRTGFGNATALRHHFRAWRGTTPNAYRRLFRGDPNIRQLK